MKKRILVAVIIAVLAGFFASRYPDGLDKVSGMLGFSGLAKENGAVMKDYTISFIGQTPISSAIAGIIGVFIVFGVFEVIYLMLRKKAVVPSEVATSRKTRAK